MTTETSLDSDNCWLSFQTIPQGSCSSSRRTLTDEEVEDWIDELVATRRKAGINRLRDEARAPAPQLNRTSAMQRPDALISAALSTGDDKQPRAPGWRVELRAAPSM